MVAKLGKTETVVLGFVGFLAGVIFGPLLGESAAKAFHMSDAVSLWLVALASIICGSLGAFALIDLFRLRRDSQNFYSSLDNQTGNAVSRKFLINGFWIITAAVAIPAFGYFAGPKDSHPWGIIILWCFILGLIGVALITLGQTVRVAAPHKKIAFWCSTVRYLIYLLAIITVPFGILNKCPASTWVLAGIVFSSLISRFSALEKKIAKVKSD